MRGESRNAKRRRPEPKVIDLMEALRASVAQSDAGGARRGRAAGKKEKRPKAAPRRSRRTAA